MIPCNASDPLHREMQPVQGSVTGNQAEVDEREDSDEVIFRQALIYRLTGYCQ
jgi:hypothetical protein